MASPLTLTAVILLSLLFSGITDAVKVRVNRGEIELVSTVAEQRKPDYFIFALQWPSTFCRTHSQTCCKQNACCRKESEVVEGFTIGGLWPEYEDGSWPSCCPGPAYDETQIESLIDDLDLYWPTLNCKMVSSCNSTKRPYWAHQWEKFGTCSTSVTGNQYGYFKKAIDLYFQYDASEILYQEGVPPSNTETYTLSDVVSAIKENYKVTPQVTCNENMLNEVRFCLTDEFKLRDCPESTSKCPEQFFIPIFQTRVTATKGRLISGAQSS